MTPIAIFVYPPFFMFLWRVPYGAIKKKDFFLRTLCFLDFGESNTPSMNSFIESFVANRSDEGIASSRVRFDGYACIIFRELNRSPYFGF